MNINYTDSSIRRQTTPTWNKYKQLLISAHKNVAYNLLQANSFYKKNNLFKQVTHIWYSHSSDDSVNSQNTAYIVETLRTHYCIIRSHGNAVKRNWNECYANNLIYLKRTDQDAVLPQ